MKLYTCTGAPSPRRVTLFIQAKGLEMEQIEVDLQRSEHLASDFLKKSPDGTVPVLELDDGRTLWDSIAIRRYIEDRHPQPALLGTSAEGRAEIIQWTHWVVEHGLLAVAEAFRNRFPGFKNHALTGRHPVAQIEALAERGLQRYPHFLDDLNERLDQNPFVAGPSFSAADIDALVTVDFAERAIKLAPGDAHPALQAWRSKIAERLGRT